MQGTASSAVKNDRRIINFIPIIAALVLFLVLIYKLPDKKLIDASVGFGICNTMIGAWATCLGFMITAVSILLMLGNSKYIEMLKRSGHFKTVLISFTSCCVHILISLAILIALVLRQKWSVEIFALLCASTVDVLLIMGICLYFLFVIIIKLSN